MSLEDAGGNNLEMGNMKKERSFPSGPQAEVSELPGLDVKQHW